MLKWDGCNTVIELSEQECVCVSQRVCVCVSVSLFFVCVCACVREGHGQLPSSFHPRVYPEFLCVSNLAGIASACLVSPRVLRVSRLISSGMQGSEQGLGSPLMSYKGTVTFSINHKAGLINTQ